MSGINVRNLSFKADPQINAAPVPTFDTLAPMPAELAGMPQSTAKDTVSISQPGVPGMAAQIEEPKQGRNWLMIGAALLGTALAIFGLHKWKPQWFEPLKKVTGNETVQKITKYPRRGYEFVKKQVINLKNRFMKLIGRGEKAAEGAKDDAVKPAADAGAPKPAADAGAPKPAADAGAPKPAADAGAPKPVADAGAGKPVADKADVATSIITNGAGEVIPPPVVKGIGG